MCSNGDFTIASGGNEHQVLGAKAINLKTNHYIFGEIFLFPPFMLFTHCHWILQFGEILPKKNNCLA
jgi:hypothetical protein